MLLHLLVIFKSSISIVSFMNRSYCTKTYTIFIFRVINVDIEWPLENRKKEGNNAISRRYKYFGHFSIVHSRSSVERKERSPARKQRLNGRILPGYNDSLMTYYLRITFLPPRSRREVGVEKWIQSALADSNGKK